MSPKLCAISLCLVLSFFHQIPVCNGEKILVVAFVSTKSHMMTYMPLIEELGKRGHNITVLSPIRPSKQLLNVKQILSLDAEKLSQSFVSDPLKNKESNTHQQPYDNIPWFVEVCRKTYDMPQVTALMNETFDLIFTLPIINECAFGLTYRVGAPLVFFIPVAVPNYVVEYFGGYFHHSFVPNTFSGMPTDMSFYERMIHMAYDLWFRFFFVYYYQPAIQAVIKEKVGEDVPSIDEIYSNGSLILSNGHFSLHKPRALLPDIVDVGGLHSRPPNPLPQDLEDFVSNATQGFIYFSLGSAIKAHSMREEKRKIFVNVFAKLKQRVIWKWETDSMSDLPSNVLLQKFLPQQDLLGHRKIKMFISHCGGGSTEEAVYHAVPVIAMPIFGDQVQNSKLAKELGHVVEVDWNDLNEENLYTAIQTILQEPKFQEKADKISIIYKDQPEHPLTRAVYWVEYVMRHKGASHLRSVGRKLNFFQYHSIDVLGTYFITLFVLVLIGIKIFSKIFYVCCAKGNWKEKPKTS